MTYVTSTLVTLSSIRLHKDPTMRLSTEKKLEFCFQQIDFSFPLANNSWYGGLIITWNLDCFQFYNMITYPWPTWCSSHHVWVLKSRKKVERTGSIHFNPSVVSDSLRSRGLHHARPPCPSSTPGVNWNSYPLSQRCHPTISSYIILCSSCAQSFPVSGSVLMSQLFPSGGQSIGVSASTSVLPMNIQDWSPLGWTGWISLLSKGLWRVFSSTTVQKHQFFSAQFSL